MNIVQYSLINSEDICSSITKDQIIPIVVGGFNYNIQKSTVLVNAYPFIPMKKDECVYKIDNLSKDNIDYLNEFVYPKLKNILNERDDILSKKRKKRDGIILMNFYIHSNKKWIFLIKRNKIFNQVNNGYKFIWLYCSFTKTPYESIRGNCNRLKFTKYYL
jgi:hypothetical protein